MGKFIKLEGFSGRIHYPVGADMKQLLNATTAMSGAIKRVIARFYKLNSIDIDLLVTGSSGAMVGSLVATKLLMEGYRVRVCHLKKEGEKSHSDGLEPLEDSLKIIVDDFIAVGETVNRIYNGFRTPIDIICVTGMVDDRVIKFPYDHLIADALWSHYY